MFVNNIIVSVISIYVNLFFGKICYRLRIIDANVIRLIMSMKYK